MRFACLLIYFALGEIMFASANQSNEIAHLKSLVSQAELHARSFGARDADGLMDAIPNLCYKAEFRALQESLAKSWQVALSNLDAFAEDDMAKTILLCSCWSLSTDDFVAVLNSSALLVEEGKLNRNIFRWCQSPVESPLTGFLARNYKDPAVQDVIKRSRKIFQDQPDLVAQYDSLLTGESRRKLEQFEAAMRENRTSDSNHGQEPIIQKSIVQDTTQAEAVADSEEGRASSVGQSEKYPVKVAPVEKTQMDEQKRGFVLPAIIGIIAVLSCVGIWLFRSNR